MAAVVALATVAGALGGALATAGVGKLMAGDCRHRHRQRTARSKPRWRGSMPILLALKASLEHTAKTGATQFNKTSDRLDKVEKAQAEPAAKLAKLSDAVAKLSEATDKLRAAQASAARAAQAKDVRHRLDAAAGRGRCRCARTCGSAQA